MTMANQLMWKWRTISRGLCVLGPLPSAADSTSRSDSRSSCATARGDSPTVLAEPLVLAAGRGDDDVGCGPIYRRLSRRAMVKSSLKCPQVSPLKALATPAARARLKAPAVEPVSRSVRLDEVLVWCTEDIKTCELIPPNKSEQKLGGIRTRGLFYYRTIFCYRAT